MAHTEQFHHTGHKCTKFPLSTLLNVNIIQMLYYHSPSRHSIAKHSQLFFGMQYLRSTT